MRVLGLDSAERTGWAVVETGAAGRGQGLERLVAHGILPARGGADVEAAVAELAPHAPDLVCVEAPFVKINAATGLTLAVLLGRWLQAWHARGARTSTVLGSTWQIQILTPLINGHSHRTVRKAAARTWCRGTFGVDLGEDEADAVGIATWALRTERRRALEAA